MGVALEWGGWGVGMSDYSYREIQIRKRTGDLSSVGAGRHQEKIQRQDVTALWLSRPLSALVKMFKKFV